jgi:hypothetical protein
MRQGDHERPPAGANRRRWRSKAWQAPRQPEFQNNSMPLPRLSAGEIDGGVDVPIRRLAMLDQMENAHCFSGMLARGFVECHGWHLLISFTKIANVNNGDPSRKRQSSVQSSAFKCS